jgi:hypothetical protein
MGTTRRELLGAGASAAIGLFPLGKTSEVFAQASTSAETPAARNWDDGDLAHLLPTSSHDRILIRPPLKSRLRPRLSSKLAISASQAFDPIRAGRFGSFTLPNCGRGSHTSFHWCRPTVIVCASLGRSPRCPRRTNCQANSEF